MPLALSALQQREIDFKIILERIFAPLPLMAIDYDGKYHGLSRYATRIFNAPINNNSASHFFDAAEKFTKQIVRELDGCPAFVSCSRVTMDDTMSISIYIREGDVEHVLSKQANQRFAEAIGRG